MVTQRTSGHIETVWLEMKRFYKYIYIKPFFKGHEPGSFEKQNKIQNPHALAKKSFVIEKHDNHS